MDKNNEVRKRMEKFIQWGIAGLKAWQDSAVVKELECVSYKPETMCEFCASYDGKIIPIKNAVVGDTVGPFRKCVNFNTTGCNCAFKPVVDTKITSN